MALPTLTPEQRQEALKKAAGRNVKWVAVDGMVDQLRAVKDSFEIDRLRDAARLGSGFSRRTRRDARRIHRPL